MTTVYTGMDLAKPGGDCTAIAAICPICKALHMATLDENETLVGVADRCNVCGTRFDRASLTVDGRSEP